MQVFKNYDAVLRGIIAAFKYNRDEKYLIDVLEQVKRRLNAGKWEKPIDDTDIICSILYYTYGDYGTSPRYGWFDIKQLKDEFIKIIDDEIKELKEFLEEVEDEQN